jgi:hypothetical protein
MKIFIVKLYVSTLGKKAKKRSKREERKIRFTLISPALSKKNHNVSLLLSRFEINTVNRKFLKATQTQEKSHKPIKSTKHILLSDTI